MPREVYQNAVINNSSLSAPRDLKQVQNRKYSLKRKRRTPPGVSSNNVADHVQQVIGMVQTHDLVQEVIYKKGSPAAVIL